jgi:hypothetical protein
VNDFRQHARWCPAGLPADGRRLDVFPDYGAFPVWEPAGMSPPERLGISAALVGDLLAWQDWWERHSQYGHGDSATKSQWANWRTQGEALCERLAHETGAHVVYLWQPRHPGDTARETACTCP